jgi:hypothetical protein
MWTETKDKERLLIGGSSNGHSDVSERFLRKEMDSWVMWHHLVEEHPISTNCPIRARVAKVDVE